MERNESFRRLLQARGKHALQLSQCALEQRELSTALKGLHTRRKRQILSERNLSTWRNGYDRYLSADITNRPSDKLWQARTYSKMDEELWYSRETRAWFEKGC
ncbi:unnamed protein product, partial [Chrysoparadoxa australica]